MVYSSVQRIRHSARFSLAPEAAHSLHALSRRKNRQPKLQQLQQRQLLLSYQSLPQKSLSLNKTKRIRKTVIRISSRMTANVSSNLHIISMVSLRPQECLKLSRRDMDSYAQATIITSLRPTTSSCRSSRSSNTDSKPAMS